MIIGYAHDLRCLGPSDCSCETVLPVRNKVARAWGNRYHEISANEAGHIRISDGPASVLIPPGRDRSRLRGMRP